MSGDSQKPGEKKIIIDEDWKSRVETEKEQQSRQPPPQAEPPADEAQEPSFPPASLSVLITSLGMQTMMALGLVATTEAGPPKPRLNEARHLIDTLAVLEEKTAGNRTPQETALLNSLLHELRLGFVRSRGEERGS